MAENTTLNPGTGGDVISTDDIAGVKVQRVKVQFGVDGSATDVSASDPLPVVADLPSGAATAAKQDTGNTSLATIAGAVAGTEVQVDVLTLPSIAGTVTANAGTNLNTSALALEAGGNLAAAATSLAALDNAVSGNELQVDVVTLPALAAGTNNIGDVDVASIAAGDNNIGNVDIVTVPTDPFGANADAASATGSISAKLRFIASTGIPVTGTVTVGSHAVTNAGTFAVQNVSGGLTQGMVDETGSSAVDAAAVGGGTPHDSVDSGNPLPLGAKAETSPKGITLVADGDRTRLYADADGILMVKLNTSNADLISERIADTSGTSTAFTNFSAVASTYNYVTAVSAFNSSAGACYVDIRDGTAGSVLYTLYLPAGGGCVIPAGTTPLFRSSANTALAYDVSGAITTVYINMTGFQSKA